MSHNGKNNTFISRNKAMNKKASLQTSASHPPTHNLFNQHYKVAIFFTILERRNNNCNSTTRKK
jgi:hypothetical protein